MATLDAAARAAYRAGCDRQAREQPWLVGPGYPAWEDIGEGQQARHRAAAAAVVAAVAPVLWASWETHGILGSPTAAALDAQATLMRLFGEAGIDVRGLSQK